eukprot:IDg21957t1
MHSIQTPIGVYTPTRMLQGGSDSGNHFQAVSQDKFEAAKIQMLQWIDDFLLYAKSEADLLISIENFLSVCKEFGFKVHAEKSTFFRRKAKFCGRLLSEQGAQYDPRHFNALLNMKSSVMLTSYSSSYAQLTG